MTVGLTPHVSQAGRVTYGGRAIRVPFVSGSNLFRYVVAETGICYMLMPDSRTSRTACRSPYSSPDPILQTLSSQTLSSQTLSS